MGLACDALGGGRQPDRAGSASTAAVARTPGDVAGAALDPPRFDRTEPGGNLVGSARKLGSDRGNTQGRARRPGLALFAWLVRCLSAVSLLPPLGGDQSDAAAELA